MSYLFRDTDLAARRLKVLADVYAPTSRAFLEAVVTNTTPRIAVDLGCGPGYTTRLLAEVTACKIAVGIDASEYFLSLARQDAPEHISFLSHDVTQVPFPIEQSDLIFCRFLLTHLQDPQSIIERWATQLGPRGLLLVEEVEWIESEHPTLSTYLSIVAAMLEQQANQLYIGPALDAMPVSDGLQKRMSRVYHHPVSTKQAATMFSMNIPAWKQQPFIQQRYGLSMIEQLEQELLSLAATSTAEGEITWGMRQIAYEATQP
jgi:ubiquinone/menaquinone biosynthesis C-methylase UbiE